MYIHTVGFVYRSFAMSSHLVSLVALPPCLRLSCHFLAHEDTGMMSTLFIGPQDWVFRLEELLPLLIGVAAGMVLAAILFWVVAGNQHVTGHKEVYAPVATMNEMKVKVQD